MTLAAGTRVRRYEVTAPLGAGGMGEVYLARDVELDRTVALKILPNDGGEHDSERVRRFVQEAKAAIALSHPNVAHIYDAGDENGVRFMAMEYVEGETLRARMQRERLSLEEALGIAQQIASALSSAHAAGIVHRDIKPENVMLRPDGYVKVLDFGLAKLTVAKTSAGTEVLHTAPGVIMGTMQYMSPEQLRGAEAQPQCDVFSLGVVLYEMVSGRRPFEASTPSGIIAAILTEEPKAIEDAPVEVQALIAKALAKNPEQRFASAREMADALKRVQHDTHRIRSGDVPTQVLVSGAAPPARTSKPLPWIIGAAAVIAVAVGAWWMMRARRITSAHEQVPRVAQLAESGKYFEAWDLGQSLRPILGGDEQLTAALQNASEKLNVDSTPSGAQVYLNRILANGDVAEERTLAGTTPLKDALIARGDYILTIEKSGYASAQRSITATPLRTVGVVMPQRPSVKMPLAKAGGAPKEMVLVDGGPYNLTGATYIADANVTLAPFFIDRFEVSNEDFETFVRAGGYRRREFWKHPIVKDGKTLSFGEAMALFRDTTGFSGPRNWAQGKYPQGTARHPVTNITWYEAAAFAESKGKQLPTAYQWDKAARNGLRGLHGQAFPWGQVLPGVDVMRRANFRGTGPMAVDTLPSGMSAWGAYHLAGNVSEWLRNPHGGGFTTAGGSFDDATYAFANYGAFPGSFSDPKLGFRCVRAAGETNADQGGGDLTMPMRPPVYHPVSDAEFAVLRRSYDYPKTPLNARPIERIATSDWIREAYTYSGAGGRTSTLYLYLPTHGQPPYQVVHYVPAGDVAAGFRKATDAAELVMSADVRAGRAVFVVLLPGYIGREDSAPSRDVQDLIDATIDTRRAIDYVLSRPDIDKTRLGFFGMSSGASTGFFVTAVDGRYRAVMLSGAGLFPEMRGYPDLVNRANFIPRIAAPKVMIHGNYDEIHPLKTHADPVFALMRGEKQFIRYDGGHVPPLDWVVVLRKKFFDEKLGPVN
jgi:eukaryotic-like serine/threonine-protein kinase